MDEQPSLPASGKQQQRPPQSLEPSQRELLWRTCETDDTKHLIAYLTALSAEGFEPSPTDLGHALHRAITAPDGPHYTTASYLVNDLQAPVGGQDLISAIQLPLLLSEKKNLLNWFWEHGGEDVEVNRQVDGENTLLLKAVHMNDEELVRWMLQEKGADPNFGPRISVPVGMWGASDLVPDSGSVLAAAVKSSTIPIVELLVQHGAVLSTACVVHCAVQTGKQGMLEKVLELGGDVEEQETFAIFGLEYVGTPLVRAVKKGDVEIVRTLLEKGASVWGTELVNIKGRLDGKVAKSVIEMVRDSGVSEEVRKLVIDAWAQHE